MVRFISGNRLASRQAAEQEAAILKELSDLPYILTYRGHITASRACFLFTECALWICCWPCCAPALPHLAGADA